MTAAAQFHRHVPCLEDLARAPFADSLQEDIRADHQVLASALQELIHLVRGQPATLHHFLGEGTRVGKTPFEVSQNAGVGLGRVEKPVALQIVQEARYRGRQVHDGTPRVPGNDRGGKRSRPSTFVRKFNREVRID